MLEKVQIKLVHPQATVPTRANNDNDNIGYDLYAPEDFIIPAAHFINMVEQLNNTSYPHYYVADELYPGSICLDLGIQIAFDSINYGAFIEDRSSWGKRLIHHFAGVIEGVWRGNWAVVLMNFGKADYCGKAGERVAQVVFKRKENPIFEVVDALPPSLRGDAGWGASGK